MNPLLTSLIFSLLAAVGVWLMSRRNPAGRVWLTTGALTVLLLLPLLALLPKYDLAILPSAPLSSDVMTEATGIPWWLIVWSAGALAMVLRMIRKQIILGRWVASSEILEDEVWEQLRDASVRALGLGVRPEIRVMHHLSSPVVTGLWKPVILIPPHASSWSAETQRMVLLHELTHLKRKDLWTRYAADLTCAVHWFNPAVWWLRSKLLSQCEYACDAQVVRSGADKKTYLSALCEVVEHALCYRNDEQATIPSSACAMADHAPLILRTSVMLDDARPGKPWVAASVAISTTSCALGLTLVRPTAEHTIFENPDPVYTQDEVELRHSANPFPGE